jgi:uncharacterized repeat protein (TIGR02543 family)
MKKTRILIFAIIIIFTFSIITGKSNTPVFTHEAIFGELMHEVENENEALLLAEKYNLEIISISKRGLALFKTENQETYHDLLQKGFSANGIYEPMAPPWARPGISNDPLSKDQFSLTLMDTPQAWDLTTGNEDVIIAIIDSGIDVFHEEFVGRISPLSYNSASKKVGLDFVHDTDGHGTMVAGIIAANKDNQKGIAGIVQNSKLMVIKASEDGKDTYTDAAIIEAIYYAVENGSNVINISLGGTYANPNTRNAVNYALEQGVIIVAASGNDGNDTPIYPAAFKNTISVGSVKQNLTLSDFTSFGITLDVVAPGDNVLTTYLGNQYYYAFGTSFAAPQVTGVIALMMSYNPQWSAEDIITRVKKTATDLGDFGPDDYYGYGFVNTYDALTLELVEITFDVDGGIEVPTLLTAKDRPFKVSPASKGYHTFEGWYLDQNFEIPFVEGTTSVNQNTTLYARFEPFKYIITFVTSGTPIDSMIVNHGSIIEFDDATKEGHTFRGWYLDSAYRFEYIEGAITKDLTLYAKFDINTYTIDFVTSGEPVSSIEVNFMSIPILPEAIKEGFVFDGWYLDPFFNDLYIEQEVSASFTLYAKFVEPIYHTVSFVSEGTQNDDIFVLSGKTLTLPTSEKENKVFVGWYQDSDFIVLYENGPVFNDFSLYAKFVPVTHLVRFFNHENQLLEEYNVSYGQAAAPTVIPQIEKTDALTFYFIGWSESLDEIKEDLNVYPVYEFIYNPDVIRIAAGLDTIQAKDSWFDGGLNVDDPNIKVMIRSTLDQDQVGQYFVYYDLYVFDTHIDTLTRVINVRPKIEEVIITLNPDVTTIKQGELFVDQGAQTNIGTLETIGQVDTTQVGVYQIKYKVTLNDRTFTRSKFVYVIKQSNEQNIIDTSYYKREQGWWLA